MSTLLAIRDAMATTYTSAQKELERERSRSPRCVRMCVRMCERDFHITVLNTHVMYTKRGISAVRLQLCWDGLGLQGLGG